MRDLVVASIALKYTQSNSVCYAKNGQVKYSIAAFLNSCDTKLNYRSVLLLLHRSLVLVLVSSLESTAQDLLVTKLTTGKMIPVIVVW